VLIARLLDLTGQLQFKRSQSKSLADQLTAMRDLDGQKPALPAGHRPR